MKGWAIIVGALVLVGGLNWGLWGAFQFDLVAAIFGGNETLMARVVYALVGVSAIVMAVLAPKLAKGADA